MYLRKARNSKTGRTYLSIVHNYRDSEKKVSRTKVIRPTGYLDKPGIHSFLKNRQRYAKNPFDANVIMQMGLFMDNNAIPVTYELFSGNTNDCLTCCPQLRTDQETV